MLYVGSFKAIGPVSAFRPNCSAKPFYDPPVMIPRYQHKCRYLLTKPFYNIKITTKISCKLFEEKYLKKFVFYLTRNKPRNTRSIAFRIKVLSITVNMVQAKSMYKVLDRTVYYSRLL